LFDNSIIRREKLTAYQSWRLADFAATGVADVPLPTVAELEQIRHAAQAEGYAAGIEEGRQEVERQAAQLRVLVGSMQEALSGVDQQVAQQLLQLALACARKVVDHALHVRPELVLESLRDAIAELPAFKGALTVELHPLDIELVRAAPDTLAAGNAIVLRADSTMQRGGCRLHTAESAVDSSIDTRWQRVVAALSLDAEPQAGA
jgi:flagellar assembly protein FliH